MNFIGGIPLAGRGTFEVRYESRTFGRQVVIVLQGGLRLGTSGHHKRHSVAHLPAQCPSFRPSRREDRQQAISFSRCTRIRVVVTRINKATKRLRSPHRSSSEHAGGGHWHPHDQCFEPRNVSVRRKRKAERRQTLFTKTIAPCGAARALQGALAYRRSTTALAKGSHRPKGSARARLRAESATGRFAAVASPTPASTSRAGHNAGRHDTRDARERQ